MQPRLPAPVLDQFGREARVSPETLVRRFQTELAEIKEGVVERNNAGSNSGLNGLLNGLFSQGQFAGAPYQEMTISQPYTLANSNAYTPISLNRILLSYSFMTQGLFRTVVCQPVDDAFGGGGPKIKSAELDPVDLKLLNRTLRRTRGRRDLEKVAKTIGGWVNYNACANLSRSDMSSLKMLAYWGRLYGGSGLVINTDQDFRQPLNTDLIREDSPLVFIPADRWELVLSNLNIFDYKNGIPYNYYGYPLHSSRVIQFLWNEAPSYIRLRLQGWGMSEMEACIRSVNSFLKFENMLFELLDEAKIDVWRIQGFNTSLASGATTSRVTEMITLANQLKNYQNAIVMDKNDEYDHKDLGSIFSGLAGVWEQLRLNLCAALKMPYNKLFGQSADGFGSGEDSLENYNSTLHALRDELETPVLDVAGLRCQQLFGFAPEDLEIEWPPLRRLKATEEEEVKNKKQTRILERFDRGLETGQESSEELKNEGLLNVDTEVLRGEREALPMQPGEPGEGDEGGEDNKMEKFAAAAAKAKGRQKAFAA